MIKKLVIVLQLNKVVNLEVLSKLTALEPLKLDSK